MTVITYKCDVCGKEIKGKYCLTFSCKWVQRIGVKRIITDENVDLCPDCFRNFKKFIHKE